jgi:hypothetical protein
MQTSTHALSRESDALMREGCVAIGRQLHAAYEPIVAQPLPRGLGDLLAHLVAREESARRSDRFRGPPAAPVSAAAITLRNTDRTD